MSPIEKDLDKTLSGGSEPDQETGPLVELAHRLEDMMSVDTPDASRERALFATAAGTRRRPTAWRYLAPAIAVTSLLAAVYFAGRAATPGNALYPVRKALQQVDLAPEVSVDVAARLAEIERAVEEAESIVENRPRRARLLAAGALKRLGAAEELIEELPNDQRDDAERQALLLDQRAVAVFALSVDEEEPESVDALEDRIDEAQDRREERREEAADEIEDTTEDRRNGSDDSSGSGSGSGDDSGSGSSSDDGSG